METLLEYDVVLRAPDGTRYGARACGREREDGLWEGWIEFPPAGEGEVLRSGRETTQPNRADALYWATGLTATYLDGALLRLLKPVRAARPAAQPAHAGPASGAEPAPPATATAVLDPFHVYAEGDEVLRGQLHALSAAQLRNIVLAYRLSDATTHELERMTPAGLIAVIMRGAEDEAQRRRGERQQE